MVEAAYDPLDDFIAFLFEGLEGLIYVAAKTLPTGEDDTTMEWKQEFFNYPEDITKVKRVIKEVSKTHEIYLAPALFSSPKATKENFKVSNVIWADFDGTIPDYLELQPSYVVQSSNAYPEMSSFNVISLH